MKYIIKNGLLLMLKGNNFSLEKSDVYINGNIIEFIGKRHADVSDGYVVFDASDKIIMPGLINSHTHIYMSFLKNSADDLPFNTWLFDRIIPLENKLEKSDFYFTTLLGCIEMIRSGVTSFLDMHICEDECISAVAQSGMRAFTGKCLRGTDLYSDANEDFKKILTEKEKFENELIKTVLSPHSVYSCSEKMLRQIAREAEKRDMIKNIHLSESSKEVADCHANIGKSPVELLDNNGFLDNKTVAAHCVKLSENDIDILAEKNVNVATNPSSNAKLGNGIAPIPRMMEKNINICLGTDSSASNNSLNMFGEMKFFSLVHKASNNSATVISASDALRCATVNPAKALGLENKAGIISQGAFADLIFIDTKQISMFPNSNISSLCYSANGTEVDSVMVGGKFLMKNRELTTIDEEKVYYEVNKTVDRILRG